MINLQEIICQLTANAQGLRSLVQPISDEQAQWQPSSDAWSMKQVMEHVYNEERIDFRKILRRMLNAPLPPAGVPQHEEYVPVASCRQALEGFLVEREASIQWLLALEMPDWEVTSQWPFGPTGDVTSFSAGDVLLSWVEHDILHLRQVIELLHAWNEKQAPPYSLMYAGGW
jgi:uncharacterized damage-inducible protein DinB